MLTGPWIILQYDGDSERRAGMVVFHRSPGETVDEFLYLLDYMRQHGLFDLERLICIRAIDKTGMSLQNFQKARLHYIEAMGATGEEKNSLLDAINSIKFELINNVIPTFSEIELGMSYDR